MLNMLIVRRPREGLERCGKFGKFSEGSSKIYINHFRHSHEEVTKTTVRRDLQYDVTVHRLLPPTDIPPGRISSRRVFMGAKGVLTPPEPLRRNNTPLHEL